MTANAGQRGPTTAPTWPTKVNAGPQKPTQSNEGQRGLMWDNEDSRQDDGAPNDATCHLGPGMFLFSLFILFTNDIYVY